MGVIRIKIPENVSKSYSRFRNDPLFYESVRVTAKHSELTEKEIVRGRGPRVIVMEEEILGFIG